MEFTEEELGEFAAQLSHLKGVKGIEVGESMRLNNAEMISRTMESLQLSVDARILELGHGNGYHISGLLVEQKVSG